MNRTPLIVFLLFYLQFFNSQSKFEDTLKTREIETVIINERDYTKVNISYDLAKETNTRLLVDPFFEIGLAFRNTEKRKGRVSNVKLYLHKTEKERAMTTLEIIFYELDTLTGKPGERINAENFYYTPPNKARKIVNIDVLKNKIPFPENGIFVAIKWLPTPNGDKKVGPSVRLTAYSEELTFMRHNGGNWIRKGNIFSKSNRYTNLMMGIDVYYKKKKNEN